MHRFKLYKLSNSFSNEKASDVKYIESNYVFERNLNPVGESVSIYISKEKERKFYRKKFEGSLTFSESDYYYIESLLTDDSEIGKARYLSIEENEGSGWEVIWKGFFKPESGEYKNCQVTFKNFDVFDRYSEILAKMSLEYNMIDSDNYPVYIPDIGYSYDEPDPIDVQPYFSNSVQPCPNCSFAGAPSPAPNQKWTVYKAVSSYITAPPASGYLWYIQTRLIYRRDYQYATTQPDSDWIKALPEEELYVGSGIYKWVRNYYNQGSPNYSQTDDGAGKCVCEIDISWAASDLNVRGKSYHGVIDDLVERLYSVNSYKSNFFSGWLSPNIVTGDNPNFYAVLTIYQKSDLKRTSNPATIGMIDFSDIERWSKNVFNCFWHIDDDGRFVIEHQKYYDGGLSYTLDKQIGISLKGNKFVKSKLGFSFVNDEIPRYEKFICMDKQDEAFNGVPIEYTSSRTTDDEDNINLEHFTENLTLDIRYIIQNVSEVSNDGFVIIATEDNNGAAIKFADNLYITGLNLPNGDLAYPNLQYNLFRYGRFLPYGLMNNIDEDFYSYVKYKVQEEISFKFCGLNSFDPYKLVETDMGEGEVINAKYNLKIKELTLNLKYNG